VSGLCGRFIRGVKPDDFELLSDEPGKVLSWVCNDELLQSVLGKTAVEAMYHIGFNFDWLEERVLDGTVHKLVVFPARSSVNVTWDNLFELIGDCYDPEVLRRLEPHLENFKSKRYEDLDPKDRFGEITKLPVKDKYLHPEFLTVERFLALEEPVSLYHARGFFYCTIGCNSKFTGTGLSPDGHKEFMMKNMPIDEISGCVVMDLEVSMDDITTLKQRVLSE